MLQTWRNGNAGRRGREERNGRERRKTFVYVRTRIFTAIKIQKFRVFSSSHSRFVTFGGSGEIANNGYFFSSFCVCCFFFVVVGSVGPREYVVRWIVSKDICECRSHRGFRRFVLHFDFHSRIMSSGRSFDTRVLHDFLLAGPCYRWPPYWKQFCFPSQFKFPCVGRSLEDESEVNDFSFFCVCVGFLKSKVHLYSLHSREKRQERSRERGPLIICFASVVKLFKKLKCQLLTKKRESFFIGPRIPPTTSDSSPSRITPIQPPRHGSWNNKRQVKRKIMQPLNCWLVTTFQVFRAEISKQKYLSLSPVEFLTHISELQAESGSCYVLEKIKFC